MHRFSWVSSHRPPISTHPNLQPLLSPRRQHTKHPNRPFPAQHTADACTALVCAITSNSMPLRTFTSSLIIQVPHHPPMPNQPLPRPRQSCMQLLHQLRFGWQFGPVLGHGDAVFVHFQKLHLVPTGLGAQDEANRRFLVRLAHVIGWTLTVPSVLWPTCWPCMPLGRLRAQQTQRLGLGTFQIFGGGPDVRPPRFSHQP